MKIKNLIIVLIVSMPVFIEAQTKDTLFVYGPGGPLKPMEECGIMFSKKTGIPVKVIAGPEVKWIDQAKINADLVYGGAEYMLTQFKMQHPGLMDSTTRTELYKRGAGILVRPGNPKKINSLKDLTKQGVKLLEITGAGQLGMWEDLAGKQNLIEGIQKNIKGAFPNTALAIDAWNLNNKFDAMVIFSSWHNRLKDVSQLIKIPLNQIVYRGTPIAITSITDQKQDAGRFIQYLLTNEGHHIFKKWGWE